MRPAKEMETGKGKEKEKDKGYITCWYPLQEREGGDIGEQTKQGYP
jgi:hypothetical protein